MILMLDAETIAKHWHLLSEAILQSMPPTIRSMGVEGLNHVLEQSLEGRMQIWLGSQEGQAKYVVSTLVTQEPGSGISNLLIYSLTNVTQQVLQNEDWVEIYTTLMQFALGCKCQNVLAFTTSEGLIEKAKEIPGARMETLVSIPVKGGQ